MDAASKHVAVLVCYYVYSPHEKPNYDEKIHVEEYLGALGFSFDIIEIKKDSAVATIRDLVKSGKYAFFLNHCDGAWDEVTAGIEVVQTLSRYNVPYTGADAGFYDPTRVAMKMACHSFGIKFPNYAIVDTVDGLEAHVKDLRYPLIVKHFQSYSSVGLRKESRVDSFDALLRETQRMVKGYGEALIEEFIDGREFSVLVIENASDPLSPIAYQPIEFCFPVDGERGFKHYDMKWITWGDMEDRMVTDPVLAERLVEMSRKVFLGLNGTGFGRCDIRMDAAGELYMLEINPNCGIFYSKANPGSADFILLNDPDGHVGFMKHLIAAAYRRVKPPVKWHVRFTPARGFGLHARAAIAPGELVMPFEGETHRLVTDAGARRILPPHEQAWLADYAYPVGPGIQAMWSKEPEGWRPLNHSCDPTAWLDGLDLVARRAIEPGEEITIDYATFMDERMRAFPCNCGSPACRKEIRGTDHLESFVDAYGDHLSPSIAAKRAARPGPPANGV